MTEFEKMIHNYCKERHRDIEFKVKCEDVHKGISITLIHKGESISYEANYDLFEPTQFPLFVIRLDRNARILTSLGAKKSFKETIMITKPLSEVYSTIKNKDMCLESIRYIIDAFTINYHFKDEQSKSLKAVAEITRVFDDNDFIFDDLINFIKSQDFPFKVATHLFNVEFIGVDMYNRILCLLEGGE